MMMKIIFRLISHKSYQGPMGKAPFKAKFFYLRLQEI